MSGQPYNLQKSRDYVLGSLFHVRPSQRGHYPFIFNKIIDVNDPSHWKRRNPQPQGFANCVLRRRYHLGSWAAADAKLLFMNQKLNQRLPPEYPRPQP